MLKKLIKTAMISALTAAMILQSAVFAAEQLSEPAAIMVNTDIPARSAILIEPTSGKVLYEKNADERLPPASITKIMTLLLVMEAIDEGRIKPDDTVTCSPHASSMGGSQIWFEPGEQMTVHELLKATAVASANDASVALGEHIAGSEDSFVAMMNERAGQLGMKDTEFRNATGLDAESHLTTARDIATMGAELLKHPKIKEYTTIWMDSLRNGETQLVNTNRLIRFFEGATGLKTGTTDGAGHCLCASAERNGLQLVAVVLGCETGDKRFAAARTLLEYGFANFEMKEVPVPEAPFEPIAVKGGVERTVEVKSLAPEKMLVEKGGNKKLTHQVKLTPELTAPVAQGQIVGTAVVMLDGVVVCSYELAAAAAVPEMTFKAAFDMTLKELVRLC